MKHLKRDLALALALALCLSLSACGDKADAGTIPDSMEGLVMDDSVDCDYSAFLGTWLGEDSARLLVEEYNDRTRFELDDTDDALLASGEFQYAEEYGFVYAYNEHDGIAHRCWFDADNTLYIDTFGTFSKVRGDVPGETVGDVNDVNDAADMADCAALAGSWYLDGDISAASSIEIDDSGTIWSLYERGADDGDWSEVDYGTICVTGEDQYEAVSEAFEDVIYDLYLADENTMYWGGEYDCYMRA